MQARTAGELRAGREVELPPVQMELFTEAGAIVAERAVATSAGREGSMVETMLNERLGSFLEENPNLAKRVCAKVAEAARARIAGAASMLSW